MFKRMKTVNDKKATMIPKVNEEVAGSYKQEVNGTESIGNSQMLAPSSNKLTFAGPIGQKNTTKDLKKGSGSSQPQNANSRGKMTHNSSSLKGMDRYNEAQPDEVTGKSPKVQFDMNINQIDEMDELTRQQSNSLMIGNRLIAVERDDALLNNLKPFANISNKPESPRVLLDIE